MGRLVLWMQQSMDGYMEGPNGAFEWPVVADDTHTYFNDAISGRAGAFVYGRKTFEMMSGYWPNVLDDDNANTARFARLWVPMPKLVVSNTLASAEWNATIVGSADVESTVTQWKRDVDGDLILIGSVTAAAELLRLGLVDEHHVFSHPVLLGGGRRLYPDLADRVVLEHVETRVFGGGVVLNRHLVRTTA